MPQITIVCARCTLANLESAPRVNNDMTLVERFLLILGLDALNTLGFLAE